MPTEINGYSPSQETPLSSLIINEVDSNETFEKMKEKGILQDNQLYLVTDELSGGGVDIPASDTEPATGNYWLDTSAEGGNYYTAGKVDALLQNKAPAGYGLGVALSSENAITDCNDATACGWYLSRSANNAPPRSSYGVLLVSARDGSNTKTQMFLSAGSSNNSIISFRSGNGEIWGEWEYLNPPMALGEEYRTTERWLGYPVYVKTVNFGAMANEKRVEVVKNPRHVVRCSAVISEGSGTLPDIVPQALSQSVCFTSGITQNADGERVAVAISRIGTSLGTSVTATVAVWYTKLTD